MSASSGGTLWWRVELALAARAADAVRVDLNGAIERVPPFAGILGHRGKPEPTQLALRIGEQCLRKEVPRLLPVVRVKRGDPAVEQRDWRSWRVSMAIAPVRAGNRQAEYPPQALTRWLP